MTVEVPSLIVGTEASNAGAGAAAVVAVAAGDVAGVGVAGVGSGALGVLDGLVVAVAPTGLAALAGAAAAWRPVFEAHPEARVTAAVTMAARAIERRSMMVSPVLSVRLGVFGEMTCGS
jgi:hypothetical protein